MVKITHLGGAGSWATVLSKDIFQIPGLERGELCLVDIDPERLKLSCDAVKLLNDRLGKKWKITETTNRRDALADSDFIVNTIEVGGLQAIKREYEIPLKYGVDQCVGDTVGPGGIMRAMRTIPLWLEILRDAEEICPDVHDDARGIQELKDEERRSVSFSTRYGNDIENLS